MCHTDIYILKRRRIETFLIYLKMESAEIFAILSVFVSLDESIFPDISLLLIASSSRRLGYMNEHLFEKCLQRYPIRYGVHRQTTVAVRNLFSFLKDIIEIMSFGDFIQSLRHAGYCTLCERILLARKKSTVSKEPSRRILQNENRIQTFYVSCKTLIDENVFKTTKCRQLKRMIYDMDENIEICDSSNFARRQVLSDKRVILYFILCQQYFDSEKRDKILKSLRDKTSHDIDRTYLNIVFHCYKALNLAIAGDILTSNAHERTARTICSLCHSPCASLVIQLWSQYKHNVLYLANRGFPHQQVFHMHSAHENHLQVINTTCELREAEAGLWRTISSSEMAMGLLEINWYKPMSKIEEITQDKIELARSILFKMSEPQSSRRKMYYFLCLGRLEEGTNTYKACAFVRKSLSLVDSGTYYKQEQKEMENYLDKLEHSTLPKPNIF